MNLKGYQVNTLGAVRRFFRRCAFVPPAEAYREVTAEGDAMARLGADRGYAAPAGMEAVPTVCIKVPTGGGRRSWRRIR